jgi:hypothetical protein
VRGREGGVEELGERNVLADDAGSPELERPAQLVLVGGGGDHEHAAPCAHERGHQRRPVADGTTEVEVEQHEVGRVGRHRADERVGVGEVGDVAGDPLQLQREREGLGDEGVVVDDQRSHVAPGAPEGARSGISDRQERIPRCFVS